MALWTPADIADDLALWVDFADEASLTLSSGKIAAATDKAKGLSVTQANDAKRPTHAAGHHDEYKVAVFIASNSTDLAVTGYTTTARPTTVFAVIKAAADPAVSGAHTGSFYFNNANFGSAYPWTNGQLYESYAVGARQDGINTNRSVAQWNLYEVQAASGTDGWKALQNANLLRAATVTLVSFSSSPLIGKSQGNYLQGYIGEILVLEGVDPDQIELIQGYLAHKWGLDNHLPAEHPYKQYPPGYVPPTSVVSGVVMIDGQPAERTVRAFSYNSVVHTTRGEEVTESLTLGSAISDPEDGSYTIGLHQGYADEVFVVAFDDIGQPFTPSTSLTVGDRVRPSTFAGYVFECDGAGTLPSEEPTWNNDVDNSYVYGTASLRAKPFYRPQVHGPIWPQVEEEP